jgi:hypothetical protein
MNTPIKVKNQNFSSVEEACRVLDVDPRMVHNRLRKLKVVSSVNINRVFKPAPYPYVVVNGLCFPSQDSADIFFSKHNRPL